MSLVQFACDLIDIDSTSGHESKAVTWLASWLRERGYHVTEQPVIDDRANVIATITKHDPEIVFSTHIDCVPPFFPSRIDGDTLYGRGACDAKGILAAQIAALEQLRTSGVENVGLLVVVGEEHGSPGAQAADRLAQSCRYLINGEPTDNRLARATRGVYRVCLSTQGRAAHSSHPELGESAIEKLLDALVALREIDLPTDEIIGQTTYTIGMLSGGVAPNVVPPHAEADVNFRTVGPASDVRTCLNALPDNVSTKDIIVVPPVHLKTIQGFDTEVFRFTTDIPFLSSWGEPLLIGPGSVHVAHTADEHVKIQELERAVDLYTKLARTLLNENAD